jgi:Hemopexin
MVDAAYFNEEIQQAYFFSGTRYARVKYTPSTPDENITVGPATITEHWPSLAKAGFGTVDAILPVPDVKGDAYFFHGGRYARIRVHPSTSNDTIVYGPSKISETWKSLTAAGFDTVDAAIAVPGVAGEAYFFRGTKYVRIHVWDDKVVYGPKTISDTWPGLTEAGFDTVDAILPIANTHGDAYFFSGTNYAKITVVAGAPDKVKYGPKPIASTWKTLSWV